MSRERPVGTWVPGQSSKVGLSRAMSWLPFLMGHLSKNSIFCVTIRGCNQVIFRLELPFTCARLGLKTSSHLGRRRISEFPPQLQVLRSLAFPAPSDGPVISIAMISWFDTSGFLVEGDTAGVFLGSFQVEKQIWKESCLRKLFIQTQW